MTNETIHCETCDSEVRLTRNDFGQFTAACDCEIANLRIGHKSPEGWSA